MTSLVRTIKIFSLLTLVLMTPVLAELYPKMGTVNIKVSGVESGKGTLIIYFYDKKDRWMKPERAAVKKVVKAKKGDMMVAVEAPIGRRYAVSICHDENENGKMDTGFPIPKPVEPVGASYFTGNSIPRYYECSFRFNESPLDIEVALRKP